MDSLAVHILCLKFRYRLDVNITWRCRTISDLMINEQIRDKEVRLIGEDGEQIGIMSSKEAYKMAMEAELDLVKISPNAKPPVCKIIDYGIVMNWPEKKKRPVKSRRLLIRRKYACLRILKLMI